MLFQIWLWKVCTIHHIYDLPLQPLICVEENQIAIADQGVIPTIAKIIQDSIKRSSGEATDVNEDVLVKTIHLLTNLTLARMKRSVISNIAESNIDTVVSNNLIPLLNQVLKSFTHNEEIIGETTKPLRNLMLRGINCCFDIDSIS